DPHFPTRHRHRRASPPRGRGPDHRPLPDRRRPLRLRCRTDGRTARRRPVGPDRAGGRFRGRRVLARRTGAPRRAAAPPARVRRASHAGRLPVRPPGAAAGDGPRARLPGPFGGPETGPRLAGGRDPARGRRTAGRPGVRLRHPLRRSRAAARLARRGGVQPGAEPEPDHRRWDGGPVGRRPRRGGACSPRWRPGRRPPPPLPRRHDDQKRARPPGPPQRHRRRRRGLLRRPALDAGPDPDGAPGPRLRPGLRRRLGRGDGPGRGGPRSGPGLHGRVLRRLPGRTRPTVQPRRARAGGPGGSGAAGGDIGRVGWWV
ncbi:MAG: hypothetical protein AVDCRST_MAG73-3316, partial [uncultured Thermomicrobiales bacterium]